MVGTTLSVAGSFKQDNIRLTGGKRNENHGGIRKVEHDSRDSS